MGFYVVSSYVLCTLMLLSVTKADEYPVLVKGNFSGIYLHNCDNKQYVSEGVMNCIRKSVPKVERPEELGVESMIDDMCRAENKVTCCVSTLLKDCPNKREIMEGYLGRYLVCARYYRRDWITHWPSKNSRGHITRECGLVVTGTVGQTMVKCLHTEGLDEFDWKSQNMTTGEKIWRRLMSEVFNCTLNELKVHGSDIENNPACEDVDTWEETLIMAFMYLNFNTVGLIRWGFFISEEDVKTLKEYAALYNFGIGARFDWFLFM